MEARKNILPLNIFLAQFPTWPTHCAPTHQPIVSPRFYTGQVTAIRRFGNKFVSGRRGICSISLNPSSVNSVYLVAHGAGWWSTSTSSSTFRDNYNLAARTHSLQHSSGTSQSRDFLFTHRLLRWWTIIKRTLSAVQEEEQFSMASAARFH